MNAAGRAREAIGNAQEEISDRVASEIIAKLERAAMARRKG